MNLDILHTFLSELEDEESKLLNWNLTHGSFSEDELDEKICDFINRLETNQDLEQDELKKELLNRCLIFKFRDENRDLRYRTRIAEFLRLLANLRQLFPVRMVNMGWLSAPRLISDFRLLMRPRQYPKRDILFSDFSQDLNSNRIVDNFMMNIAKSIAGFDDSRKLSKFQLQATKHALTELIGLKHGKGKGMIVCAGTGSGKTLSFYLPAFMYIASIIDNSFWVKCLAIYPRNELLKDQLNETFRNANRIRKILIQNGKRPIRIGVLYGSTPNSNLNLKFKTDYGWKPISKGYICPFLVCPVCENELIWLDSDLNNGKERLFCNNCEKYITDENFILTREKLVKDPPDILFITTEMLNRKITDSRYIELLINKDKPPVMMILDEVHTYSGLNGAQISLLLRRWRYMAKANPFIVGLSATLNSPQTFFHELTNIKKDNIKQISPDFEDMENGFREYFIVAKGETASKTNLLSTTIQSIMLLSRILDPRESNKSEGMFGNRLFAFTDDLDVTNRLYWDLREAEGRRSYQESSAVLASLRSLEYGNRVERFIDGQHWKICEDIGHRLSENERKEVSRTSSQDVGVAEDSDIVVATASLEVGYNDTSIGAVLQHKAPHDSAQFIQRRGRAGRLREMRPITLTVLSDYGRDRIAYQMYEKLFSPILDEKCIPSDNKYILRMQATFSFMDWLSTKIPKGFIGSVWNDVSSPDKYNKDRQPIILNICEKILDNDLELRLELQRFIKQSLNISEELTEELLWFPPRSIINAVIPTLYRRISSGWCRNGILGEENNEWGRPLPEFVPSNLFSDLNLPELAVRIPKNIKNEAYEVYYMPLLQGMREFAPGKATLRFCIRNEFARHWVVPNDFHQPYTNRISLNEFCEKYEDLGFFKYSEDGDIKEIRCIKPLQYICKVVPGKTRESSNASLIWQTQIIVENKGNVFLVSSYTNRNCCLDSFEFFTHKDNTSLEVRRFATGSKAVIVSEDSEPVNVTFDFYSDDSKPIALGFVLDVDGLRIQLKKVDLLIWAKNSGCLSDLRTLYFDYLLKNEIDSFEGLSVFLLDWVSQVFLITFIHYATENKSSIKDVIEEISSSLDLNCFDYALNRLIGNNGNDTPQLRQDLENFLSSSNNILQICSIAKVLWKEPSEDWLPWLENIYKTTIGAAFLESIRLFDSNIDTESLVFDIGSDVDSKDSLSIYLTEDTIGGIGEIEKFMTDFCNDSNTFFDLFIETLNHNEFDLIDSQLMDTLELVNNNVGNFSYLFEQIRDNTSYSEIQNNMNDLLDALHDNGFLVSHSFIASLSHRLLRPGLNSDFDFYIYNLYKSWIKLENQLGISIEPRVWAACQDFSELEILTESFNHGNNTDNWYYKLILDMIWPRGLFAQKNLFDLRSVYARSYDMLPKFVAKFFEDKIESIAYPCENFIELFNNIIVKQGIVEVKVTSDCLKDFKDIIIDLLLTPIESETEFMMVYPHISRINRIQSGWKFCFEIL